MRCSQEASSIQDFISGELSGEDRARLVNHMSACEACRTCADMMLSFRARLRDLLRVSAPADLRKSISRMSSGGGE